MEIFVICCIAVFLIYLGFILTRYCNYHYRLKQTFKKTLKRHSNMLRNERSRKLKTQNWWGN